MKLITKYNRNTVSVMVIVFLLSTIVSYFLIKKIIKQELDARMERQMVKIQNYVGQYHKMPAFSLIDDAIVDYKQTQQALPSPAFKTVFIYVKGLGRKHFCRQLSYSLTIDGQLYNVIITNPLEGTKTLTKLMFYITLITISIFIILTLLINRVVISKLWFPFYRSIQEMRDFKVDQTKVPVFPNTEIDEFNFMIDSLRLATNNAAESYKMLKEFTENASHEIQTPLAIIRSKLDLLIQDDGLTDDQISSLRSAYLAITKLSRLNKDLLLITKIDNNQFDHKRPVNLQLKIEEKMQEFKELWHMNQVEIKAELNKASITASPELMDILISNLLSNASKHNLQHRPIHIQLSEQCLKISNPGIAKALNPDRLFKRFYKENNHNENNGLGLSIIKQICDVSGIEPSYQYISDQHTFTFIW